MSAIITLNSRLDNAKKYIEDIFNPSSSGNYTYFYTGKTIPWENEFSPDISTSSDKQIYESKFQRVFHKQLLIENTSLAVKRFNWKKNTVYSRADYNVDFTDYRTWIHPESPFYVINSEGNVYKCISNNYNSDSIIEPTGQNNSYIFLSDGYIWKFMYDLDAEFSAKFLTDTWLPVPYREDDKTFAQKEVENNAIAGEISYIHVENKGTNYTYAPTIEIRGDGENATAVAVMDGETIDYIQIANNGHGYTHAEVHIFGNGYDAKATAMISPPGGHGSNASYELGATYVEVYSELIGDEDGILPTNGTYRNIGLVLNTKTKDGNIITDEKYNTLSVINISDCSGTYLPNELLIGETSYTQGILYYDPSGTDKDILLYMVEGDFIDGENIHGQTTGEVGIYNENASTITDVDILSGDIIYKENIIFITRREIQTEKFIFVIEF
jgi:hypothetical protein